MKHTWSKFPTVQMSQCQLDDQIQMPKPNGWQNYSDRTKATADIIQNPESNG